ncbi:MAG: NAD-dependent epimerase, partial [Dermatophilaceae bacterium]|nr:NAD-dependent epimerase [Dermatophilaceae bacterium]
MTHHLVLGAGGVGRSTTAALVAGGHTVTLASRSGRVTERPWEAT